MPDPVIAAKLEELRGTLAGEPLEAIHDKERLEKGKRLLYELGVLLIDKEQQDVPISPAEAFLWAEELEKPETLAQVLERLNAGVVSSEPVSSLDVSVGPASAPKETFWTDVTKGVLTTVLAALVLYWVLPKRR